MSARFGWVRVALTMGEFRIVASINGALSDRVLANLQGEQPDGAGVFLLPQHDAEAVRAILHERAT